MTLSISQRTLRRQQAAARQVAQQSAWAWNPTLLPRWAYLGELSIPVGGTARRVDKIHIHDPVPDERVAEPLHFGSAK